MRGVIYTAMLRLPFKVITAVGAAGGFAGSVWPNHVRLALRDTVTAENIRLAGIALLVIALAYVVVLLLLKPGEKADIALAAVAATPSPITSITQKSEGEQSSNIAQAGNVTINYHTTAQPSDQQDVPTTPIWVAIEHVRRVIIDRDEENYHPAARRALRQAARAGQIAVWGRPEIPATSKTDESTCAEIWKPIPQHYWDDYKIASLAIGEGSQDRPHTLAEPHVTDLINANRYWALRVHITEIAKIWVRPKAVGSTPPPDIGLAEIVSRIYKRKGRPPQGKNATYLHEVDLEIADKVKIHRLTVWVRYAGRALEVLDADDWASGTLTHWKNDRKGELKVPTTWDPIVYTDLKFVREEIDAHWPPPKRAA